MKAFSLRIGFHLAGFVLLCTLFLLAVCCTPPPIPKGDDDAVSEMADEPEGDESDGEVFTLYSAEGEPHSQLFYTLAESDHGVVYVSAHSVSESVAGELLECFETKIFPAMPSEPACRSKVFILLSFMEGHVYGYTEFPVPERGPVVCLNALYPETLCYALAHEYQHLNAYEACLAGETALSEETDELLSDIFCELLFPDMGLKRGIISEDRSSLAKEKVSSWGADALERVYLLLKDGYSEEDLLSVMEKKQ